MPVRNRKRFRYYALGNRKLLRSGCESRPNDYATKGIEPATAAMPYIMEKVPDCMWNDDHY